MVRVNNLQKERSKCKKMLVNLDNIRHAVLSLEGEITRKFIFKGEDSFFIETSSGNFIWNRADNTLTLTKVTYDEWMIPFEDNCSLHGIHIIGDYCDRDVKIVI